MKKHQYAFTFTAYQLMRHDGELLNKTINTPESIDYKHYLKNTIIGCLTVVLDRKQLGDIAFPNLRIRQDMALWLSLLRDKVPNAYGLNQSLAYYRLTAESISANKVKAAKAVWKVYREVEHLSLLLSLYNFIGYAYQAVKKRF